MTNATEEAVIKNSEIENSEIKGSEIKNPEIKNPEVKGYEIKGSEIKNAESAPVSMSAKVVEERGEVLELEHFISLRIPVALDYLLKEFPQNEEKRKQIETINTMLCERYHLDYLKTLRSLLSDFAPFDPDADTEMELRLSKQEKNEKGAQLIKGLVELAEKCNFTKFSNEEFNEYLKLQSEKGLVVQVDLDDFQSFQVFYRGEKEELLKFPKWYFWRWKKPCWTVKYKRIFLAAQLKIEEEDENKGTSKKKGKKRENDNAPMKNGDVIIKLFKEITRENLKVVAPKGRLLMPIFDRFKIGGTAGAGLFPIAVKLFTAALNWWIFLVVLFGCLSATVKAVFSFFNSKNKYLQIYSSSLYYKNLSNNSGAITTMMEMAERQEVLEIFLGWFFLYINDINKGNPLTEKELDLKVEHWLNDSLKLNVDFEVNDALRKLVDKKIVIKHQNGSDETRYSALEPLETLRQLDEDWDNYRNFSD